MYRNRTECVKIIQMLLNKYENTGLDIDGKFGKLTDSAVESALGTAEVEEEVTEDIIDGEPNSARFSLTEYYSNRFTASGTKEYKVVKPPEALYPYIQKSMNRLEKLRAALGNRPITILSGYRSPEYNAKLRETSTGVAENSPHMRGTATDIKVSGLSPKEVYAIADKLYPEGGVGLYDTFVHVDLDYENKRPARWNG